MALDSSSVALIGIGVAFAVSVLTAIVFLILYTRLKIKNDTNIRRRVIATTASEAEKSLIVPRQPELVEEFVEQIPAPLPPPHPQPPVVYPSPVPIPAPSPPPPPQQVFIVQPTPQPSPPQPLPPPPPREPEVVVHEVIHRYEPAPPAPAPPPPQERIVRRRSWGGLQEPEDDWVLVKKITKTSGKKSKKVRDDSSDDSSDEEVETKVKRRHKKRLDRYDLATNVVPFGFRPQPQMMAGAGFIMNQPSTMMAPTAVMAQPMMAATQPTYMPFFTVQR